MENKESWLDVVGIEAIKGYIKNVYDQEVVNVEMIQDDVLQIEVSHKYKSDSKCRFYFYYSSYGCLEPTLDGGFYLKSPFMSKLEKDLWFEMVNEANKGRIINGKIYLEDYIEKHASIIESAKKEALSKLEEMLRKKKEIYLNYEEKLENFKKVNCKKIGKGKR